MLGTVLDVSEDGIPDIDPEDPQLPMWAVYEFLGSVVDAAVSVVGQHPRLKSLRGSGRLGQASHAARAELVHPVGCREGARRHVVDRELVDEGAGEALGLGQVGAALVQQLPDDLGAQGRERHGDGLV